MESQEQTHRCENLEYDRQDITIQCKTTRQLKKLMPGQLLAMWENINCLPQTIYKDIFQMNEI